MNRFHALLRAAAGGPLAAQLLLAGVSPAVASSGPPTSHVVQVFQDNVIHSTPGDPARYNAAGVVGTEDGRVSAVLEGWAPRR
jgi:hypothetical protein